MFGITVNICVYIYATLMAIECVLGQQHHQHHYYKPWPTYSLQNMPQTRFTCHDKILGGYYADPETQCQMFHVCVKAAGGVQDFRFLCPNSTAFDQEAQICADWGDIDCEQSVLYYGSDNFDLYRIGSGFESKRAPLAEEEEATFHLQRAESADIRRSKETRVDQKLRPDQTSQLSYTKHLTTSTTRNPDTYANLAAQRNPQRNNYNNYKNNNNNYNYNNNYNNNNDDDIVDDVRRLSPDASTKQPIVNYFTSTTSTTTTTPITIKPKPTTTTTSTTTTTTTERYTDESKPEDLDEIFKGSHSSHYFANRNGGREDDFQDLPTKTKQNDFSDYSRKLAETSTSGKTRVQPTRGGHRGRIQHLQQQQQQQQQQQHQQQSHFSTPSTTQRSTTTTKLIKNFTQTQTFYQTDFKAFTKNQFQKAFTPTSPPPPPTPTTTATNLGGSVISNANRFSLNSHDFQTQEKILPTTYNPASSVYRIKATTPKYPEASRDRDAGSGTETHKNNNFHSGQYDFGSSSGKTAPAANQSRRKPQKTLLTSPQNSTFVNHDEFAEFSKIKTQEPQPFKPAQVFRPPPLDSVNSAPTRSSLNQTEPRARSRGQATKLPATSYKEPKPFSAPQRQRGGSNTPNQPKQLKSTSSSTGGPTSNAQPRGFTSRGSINYKATTQRSGDNNDHNNNYTPSSHAPKKFSTLVPKDQQQYQPTTFKPTTYKKAYDNSFYQTQQTGRPVAGKTQQTLRASSTTAATPVGSSTADPHHKPGEDDGQYHPELYELDFPKNRLKLQRSTTTKTPNASKLKSSTNSNSNNNNNYQYSQTHLKTQQQNFFQQQQQQPDSDSIDLSDEEELFKTAHSLNFGAASINKLRADIFKAEKTSQQYNSQYAPNQSNLGSVQTAAPSYLPTTSSAVFSYPTYAPSTTVLLSTAKPFVALTTITTAAAPLTAPTTSPTTAANTIATRTTTTTRSPPPAPAASQGATQGPLSFVAKSHKGGSKKGSNKAKKTQKSASKRPPHADDDTSYDYAYYDSDSLSESPQTYPDYEIAEFVKTRKN